MDVDAIDQIEDEVGQWHANLWSTSSVLRQHPLESPLANAIRRSPFAADAADLSAKLSSELTTTDEADAAAPAEAEEIFARDGARGAQHSPSVLPTTSHLSLPMPPRCAGPSFGGRYAHAHARAPDAVQGQALLVHIPDDENDVDELSEIEHRAKVACRRTAATIAPRSALPGDVPLNIGAGGAQQQ